MYRIILALMIAVLVVSPVLAQSVQVERKDLTPDIAEHLKKHFVGTRRTDGPTVIERNNNDLTGWEDRASGSAEIDKLESVEGKIERVTIKDLDLSFITGDAKFVFHYKGQSSCDRISKRGGLLVDHPWGDLHPTGTIIVNFRIEKQKNGKFKTDVTIKEGHGDRPNAYLRDHIVPKLVTRLKELMEGNLGVGIDP